MNNDFKVLTNETLKNVKNRPSSTEEKITEWSRQITEAYNKKVDDWFMYCLLELGYKGERKKEEVTDFMVNNDIKLTQKVSRRKYCEIITVECETRNYKREMIIE